MYQCDETSEVSQSYQYDTPVIFFFFFASGLLSRSTRRSVYSLRPCGQALHWSHVSSLVPLRTLPSFLRRMRTAFPFFSCGLSSNFECKRFITTSFDSWSRSKNISLSVSLSQGYGSLSTWLVNTVVKSELCLSTWSSKGRVVHQYRCQK